MIFLHRLSNRNTHSKCSCKLFPENMYLTFSVLKLNIASSCWSVTFKLLNFKPVFVTMKLQNEFNLNTRFCLSLNRKNVPFEFECGEKEMKSQASLISDNCSWDTLTFKTINFMLSMKDFYRLKRRYKLSKAGHEINFFGKEPSGS